MTSTTPPPSESTPSGTAQESASSPSGAPAPSGAKRKAAPARKKVAPAKRKAAPAKKKSVPARKKVSPAKRKAAPAKGQVVSPAKATSPSETARMVSATKAESASSAASPSNAAPASTVASTTSPAPPALAAVESFEFEGARLSYQSFGRGPRTCVLLHGLLMDSQMNRELARALADRGHRVVLLDLLGHGTSDKPTHASAYRMDVYGRQVVALLDHLDVDAAIIGGTSLGANVALQVAVQAPDRVQGLVFEMPVLEWAVPAAALLFTPLLLGVRMLSGPAGAFSRFMARVPRTSNDAFNSLLSAASAPPEVITAVLHGILTGPVCPTIEERRAIDAPALVIAHTRDVIHPFSDAENLAAALPNARLVPARSLLEMRIAPERLTGEIADFLDELDTAATRSA